jgi:hypothetical protein
MNIRETFTKYPRRCTHKYSLPWLVIEKKIESAVNMKMKTF